MNYSIEDSSAFIKLDGELDHHTLRGIIGGMYDIIDTYLPKTLVIDMGGIRFMDSSGLALVIGGSRRMKELGGKLVIRDVPPQPLKVLSAVGVSRFAVIENTGRLAR